MKSLKYSSSFLSFSILICFIIVFCSFFPLLKEDSENNIYIDHYKQALKNRNCLMLWSLSQNEDFSLNSVALIRSFEFCPENHSEHLDWREFPKWLREAVLKVWTQKSMSQSDKIKQIEAYTELSKISTNYTDKTQYMIDAIQVAKQIQYLEIQQLKERLYKLSPSRHPKAPLFIEAANDYKKRNLFPQSIWIFRKVLNSKKSSIEDKVISFKNLISLYRKTRNRKKRLVASQQYATFLKRNLFKNRKSQSEYFETQIELARRYWTGENPNQALKILYSLKKIHPTIAPLARIQWMRGKIFEEKKQNKRAISEFQQGFKFAKTQRIKEDLLWSLFWNTKILKKWEQALGYIDQSIAISKDFNSRYLFWKAQVLGHLKKPKYARKVYQQMIHDAPLDFHSMVAHHYTQTPLRLKPDASNLFPHSLVNNLIAINEKELALKFMEEQLALYKKNHTHHSQDDSLKLLLQVAQSGSYLPLFQFIGSLKSKERNRLMEKYAHHLFPKVFKKEVDKAVQKFKSVSELIYSIMRQESAFNPKARSSANAIGLMQVIPSLARRVALKKGIRMKTTKDLYNPETNIFIGTAHLSSLFKKYGNSIIVNAAIYNAGPRPVTKWIQTIDTENPIEFIQNIPYKETRIYVKLIIRNYILYLLLNHPKGVIQFPKWVLSIPKKL